MKALYARWRVVVHELAKFGIVGAVNTVLDFGLFNLLRAGFGVGPLTSSAVALVIAATSSYFMNRHWTFSHRARSHPGKEYALFFVLNGIGLGLQLSCIAISHYGLHFESLFADNIAKAVGLVIGTVFRFATYKRWVFLPTEQAAGRAAAEGSVAELADEEPLVVDADGADAQAPADDAGRARRGERRASSLPGRGRPAARADSR